MRQIDELYLGKLRNDENFGFHVRVHALAVQYLTGEADAAMLAAYGEAFTAYDGAVKQTVTNSYTVRVNEADAEAAAAWRASRAYARAMNLCPDPDQAAVARRISALFDKYGDFSALGYTQKHGIYSNLLQDLAALPQADLDLCAFSIWRLAMQAAYDRFTAALRSKTQEESVRVFGAVRRTRSAADTAYRRLVRYINVMVMTSGDVLYADFIDRLNVIVAEMSAIIATRSTRAGKALAKGEE